MARSLHPGRQVAQEGKERCIRRVEAIDAALRGQVSSGGGTESDPTFALAEDAEALEGQKAGELANAQDFDLTIRNEEAKRMQWRYAMFLSRLERDALKPLLEPQSTLQDDL